MNIIESTIIADLCTTEWWSCIIRVVETLNQSGNQEVHWQIASIRPDTTSNTNRLYIYTVLCLFMSLDIFFTNKAYYYNFTKKKQYVIAMYNIFDDQRVH